MSNRLDKEREALLQPQRIEFAGKSIAAKGYSVSADNTKIWFDFKGNKITMFPYSGWFSGKGVKSGRGLKKLLKQI